MSSQQHWHRREGAAVDGAVVIFDLDGVISDATHRQGYFTVDPPDWGSFFEAGALDPPLAAGLALARVVRTPIVILSARPAAVRDSTVEWLIDNEVPFDIVIVHPVGDTRSSADFKSDEVDALQRLGFRVMLAIDDDQRNIDMYRSKGIDALYVHSGYYELLDLP